MDKKENFGDLRAKLVCFSLRNGMITLCSLKKKKKKKKKKERMFLSKDCDSGALL
jgi:hypothetical protein